MNETPITDQERTWGILSHALALAGGMLGGLPAFVAPLVIYLVYKERSAYITHHAREALNFQLSILLYAVISGVLIIVLIGFLLLPLVGIMWLVLTIVAAIAASRNEWYRYPFSIRFVSAPRP
jgi:uncharacterized Tic20 family protein